MVMLAAYLIVVGITAVTWAIAVALYQTYVGPELRRHPRFWQLSVIPVLGVPFVSFARFPLNYLLPLACWWLTAKSLFELPWPRALVLFAILAALTFLSRLAILGALEMF